MKRHFYFSAVIITALMASACTRSMSGLLNGGGAVPGATEVVRALESTATELSSATPELTSAPTEMPTEMPTELSSALPAATSASPSGEPTCAINLGDPGIWREGTIVLFGVVVSDAAGLPATLSSNNGLTAVITQTMTNVAYELLGPAADPHRIFTVDLASGGNCRAEVDITPASVDTPMPTETATMESTSLPTETPTPEITPTSTETATLTPTPTATPALAPVTGEGDRKPKSPLEFFQDLLNWLSWVLGS